MNLISIFDQEEKKLQYSSDHFNSAFLFFRYEGTAFKSKNAQSLRKAAAHVHATLKSHCKLQEQIIFPFLVTHFPKHEAAIRLLRRDHESLHETIQALQGLLEKFEKNSNEIRNNVAIRRLGVYMICLLHHHIELERNSVRSAKKELKQDEKKELKERIDRVLKPVL